MSHEAESPEPVVDRDNYHPEGGEGFARIPAADGFTMTFEPRCIHTITGCGASPRNTFVLQTFRNRQSSRSVSGETARRSPVRRPRRSASPTCLWAFDLIRTGRRVLARQANGAPGWSTWRAASNGGRRREERHMGCRGRPLRQRARSASRLRDLVVDRHARRRLRWRRHVSGQATLRSPSHEPC